MSSSTNQKTQKFISIIVKEDNKMNNYLNYNKIRNRINLFAFGSIMLVSSIFPNALMSQYSVTMTTADFFDLDSNMPEDPNESPQASYVGFEICNTTGGTLTGLEADLSNITNGTIFGLAGGQSAVQEIGPGGSLAPGECDVLYWYIAYNLDLEVAQGNAAFGRSTTLTIDVTDGTGTSTGSGTGTVTTRSSISASAGGLLNGVTVGPGVFLGQILQVDVDYEFGNTKNGDIFNLQPAGNTSFDADCFQLVNSEITANNTPIPGISVGDKDMLIYTATGNASGSGHGISVRYFFKVLCLNGGVGSSASPFASQTSGNQFKYSSNFNQSTGSFGIPTNSLTIAKTVSPTTLAQTDLPADVTYTVVLTNSGNQPISVDQVIDVLPGLFSFNDETGVSDIDDSNSTASPTMGSTGTVTWTGGNPASLFPYTEYLISANDGINDNTLTLVYTVEVPVGTTGGIYDNSVTAKIADVTVGPASASVLITEPSDISLIKLVNDSTPLVDDIITYSIVVTNDGPGIATNVEITDVVPAGLIYEASSIMGGDNQDATDPTGDGLEWTITTLGVGSGSAVTLTFMAKVTGTVTGTIFNSAQVTASDQPDPDSTPDNNIPTEDDQDNVCIAVPITICDSETYTLTAPDNLSNYQWYVGDPAVAITDEDNQSLTVSAAGVYTFTADDGNGCPVTEECPAVFVESALACSISGATSVCPGSTNTYAGPAGMTAYEWSIIGMDQEGMLVGDISSQMVNVEAANVCGSYELQLIVTDANGCTATCTYNVDVVDTEAPTIYCPIQECKLVVYISQLIPDGDPNECDGESITISLANPCGCSGASSMDVSGWKLFDNTATALFDNPQHIFSASTILAIGSPITLNCDYSENMSNIWDNGGDVAILQNDMGNEIDMVSYISNPGVNTPVPGIAIPICTQVSELTLDCAADTSMITAATAIDNCDTAPTITYTDVITSGVCSGDYTIERTWEATDDCGNSSTCVQNISVQTRDLIINGCPTSENYTACSDQSTVTAAFDAWVASFNTTDITASGGCGIIQAITFSPDPASLATPVVCNTTTINYSVTASVTDDCNTTTCTSTFIVTPVPLVANCPDPVMMPACSSEADILMAFNTWKAQFSVAGGCSAISNIGNLPTSPPNACGGMVDFTLSATDNCNVPAIECTSTFTVQTAPDLTANCATDPNLAACTSDADILIAYNAWVAGFSSTGGCGTVSDNIASVPLLNTLNNCGGQLSFTYIVNNAAGGCVDTDQCTSTFTVQTAPDLVANCPVDPNLSACTSDADILTAYNAWVAGFSATGGCGTVSDNIASVPLLNTLNNCGGQLSFTYIVNNVAGGCVDTDQCTSTFTIQTAPDLVANCSTDPNLAACTSDTDILTAYNAWVAGFSSTGGCETVTDNIASVPLLNTLNNCGGQLSFTYIVNNVAGGCVDIDQCTSTFTIQTAPNLVANCPTDPNLAACTSDADILTAYNAWVAGFSSTGGCETVTDNIASVPLLSTLNNCGGQLSFTYIVNNAAGGCVDTDQCTSTFTIQTAPDLVANCATDPNLAACTFDADILTAYNAWVAGFSSTGGCGTVTDNIASIPLLSTLNNCGGQLSFTYMVNNAAGGCVDTDQCTSTFTIQTAPDLVANCPTDPNLAACTSDADILTAYNAWVAGFNSTGGCGTVTDNIASVPLLNTLNNCGGQLSFTYMVNNAAGGCVDTDQCTSTFTVQTAPDLVANCPTDPNLAACTSDADILTAYNAWVAGFGSTGGCGTVTDNIASIPLLSTLNNCGGQLSFTYIVNNVAGGCVDTDQCTSTFTIQTAPDLVANCSTDPNLAACTSDADILTAYNAWVAGFGSTGGCGTVTDNIASVPLLSTLNNCGGQLSFTYIVNNAASGCVDTDQCTATFTVQTALDLEANCPADQNLPAGTSDADILIAYNAWVAGFSSSGGCGTVTDNITSVPLLSTLNNCGGQLSFTYIVNNAVGGCMDTDQCTATFTIQTTSNLVANCPADPNLAACTSDADILIAYNVWVAGFSSIGGCGILTDNIASVPLLSTLNNCGGQLSFTYIVNNAIGSSIDTDQCTSTFTIGASSNMIDYPSDYDGIDEPELNCEEREVTPDNEDCGNPIGWNVIDAGIYAGHPSPYDELYPCGAIKWFGTGVPSIDGCGNIQFSYTDIRVNFCAAGTSNGCFTINRTWNIIDACTGVLYTHEQKINVTDTEGPTIQEIDDLTISVNTQDCSADWDVPTPIIMDNCSDINDIYLVSSTSGNVNWDEVNQRYTITDLGIGDHEIIVQANDCCDNISRITFTLTVEDLQAPTVVCESFRKTSLTSNGIAKIWASSFDDGSNDACGAVFFKVIRMEDLLGTLSGSTTDQQTTNCDLVNGDDNQVFLGYQIYFDDYVKYCCEDVGQNDLQVKFRVFDINPGAGPVDPSRMEPGGDLYGHFNDCWSTVEVSDKTAPSISCPSDLTIGCDLWFDVAILNELDNSIFGTVRNEQSEVENIIINNRVVGQDGLALDNCSATVTIEVEENLSCGQGTISRTFTATDPQGQSSYCVQTITIADNNPFSINDKDCFDADPLDGVVWPCDYVGTTCGAATDPGTTGTPQILGDDQCNMLVVTHIDEEFPVVANACFSIYRTWTVTDWCQYDGLDPDVNQVNDWNDDGIIPGQWKYVQVINIGNATKPVFGTTADVVICDSTNVNCSVSHPLTNTISDDCTPGNILVIDFKLDIDNDGGVDFIGSNVSPYPFPNPNGMALLEVEYSDDDNNSIYEIKIENFEYPLGVHSIIWRAEDICSNVMTNKYLIEAIDCAKPTAQGVDDLIVEIAIDTKLGILTAAMLDDNSFDNCCLAADPYRVAFPSGGLGQITPPTTTQVEFDCNQLGNRLVDFWVEDCHGNWDYIIKNVIVQNSFDACLEPAMANISGNISTELDLPANEIDVFLMGGLGMENQTLTDTIGAYSLEGEMHQNFSLAPEKLDEIRKGISTLDLVLLGRHLIGLQPIDSPYKLIAADVNNDLRIDVFDMVDLQKIILLLHDEFPNNTSFRFVDAEFIFPNPDNPFQSGIPESIDINNLSGDMLADFIIVKTGDINLSANMNFQETAGNRERNDHLELLVEDQDLKAGHHYVIDFKVKNFANLVGYQFAMKFNSDVLKFQEVIPGALEGLNMSNFGRTLLELGIITMNWSSVLPIEMEDEKEAIFQLSFEAIADGKLSEALMLEDNEFMHAEAYASDLHQLDVILNYTSVANAVHSFQVFQNSPNPFKESTEISFVLPEDAEVRLSVFDISGKILEVINGKYLKGFNKISISRADLGTTGVLYYKLETDEFNATRKMIVLE